MKNIEYLNREDLDFIFEFIYRNHTNDSSVPNYIEDRDGFARTEALLESLKLNYYPTFLDKAKRLFLEINLGHFFYNGNKRLALVAFVEFLMLNEFDIAPFPTEDYREKLSELFPEYDFEEEDAEGLQSSDFGYYHLSVIIADHQEYTESDEELKEKVEEFISFSIYPLA